MIKQEFSLSGMTQNYIEVGHIKFCYKMGFSFPNNSQNLDPLYKGKYLCLITEYSNKTYTIQDYEPCYKKECFTVKMNSKDVDQLMHNLIRFF